MCSGSEAGSYLRLIDFVYHSTLGLRVVGMMIGLTNRKDLIDPAMLRPGRLEANPQP